MSLRHCLLCLLFGLTTGFYLLNIAISSSPPENNDLLDVRIAHFVNSLGTRAT